MNASNRKKPLTPELKAECQKLKHLFLAQKKALSVTQKTLASALGCNQSAISHYLNGLNPLNAHAAAIFARELKVTVDAFSPRLAKEIANFASVLTPDLSPLSTLTPANDAANGAVNETYLSADEDNIAIPFLEEVKLAAGTGQIAYYENYKTANRLFFDMATFRKIGVNPKHSVCVSTQGDSMYPIIPDGSTVAIDTAYTSISNGDIYALAVDNELLKVKQLYLEGHKIRLHSFNTDTYPDEIYAIDEIRIIGRVFWYSVLL